MYYIIEGNINVRFKLRLGWYDSYVSYINLREDVYRYVQSTVQCTSSE